MDTNVPLSEHSYASSPITIARQAMNVTKGPMVLLFVYLGLIALYALQPQVTFEKKPPSSGTITIQASGTANPIPTGEDNKDHKNNQPTDSTPASLSLTGSFHQGNGQDQKDKEEQADQGDKGDDGNQRYRAHGGMSPTSQEDIKMSDLAGTLTIGPTTYTITGGDGNISGKGEIEIHAKTSQGHELDLVLHGIFSSSSYSSYSSATTTQGKIVFTSPESKLASLYFLSLTGQANLS
jgi:hypothetical protein